MEFPAGQYNHQPSKMSSEDEATRPKKRQRMSVVCLNCKARKIKCDKKRPSCTNCVKCNVGHLCRYEAPHWVNRVINTEGQSKLDNGEKELLPQVLTGPNSGGNEAALQEEVKRLRNRLESIENSLVQSPDSSSQKSIKREYEDDIIDFYGAYNSLTIKRSGMLDHKPLSSSAITKKDHFLSLVSGYMFLCNFLKGATCKKQKVKMDKRLDNSLLMCLELLGERQSPHLEDIISRFGKERFNSDQDNKSALFPLTSLTNISKPLYIDELRSDIEKMLPPKSIIESYLDRFFKYIYPFFPAVDEKFYRARIEKFIMQEDQNSPAVKLVFEDKFDFAFLATLLIFLRFAYISIDPTTSTEDVSELLKYPIPGTFITAAQTALSQFKIMRKTKLHIVQALFYLKVYLTYAPEDGDGKELNQSQILSGTIIQSAFTMGLNRDAAKYSHLSNFQGYVNLWRKLWLSILSMDRVGSVLSGQSCVIQNVNSYEIMFPEPLDQDSPMEPIIVEELEKQQRLNQLLLEISNLVNNIGVPTRVSDVLAVVKQMHSYVTINHSLNKLIPLTKDNQDEANYKNTLSVKQNIITRSISLLIYQSLALHYESKEHYNLIKYQHFQSLVVETAIELSNILSNYLGDDYNDFIDPNYRFYLNILVENATSRVTNAFIAILSRLLHAKDMLIEAFSTNDTMMIRSINDLTSLIFRVANGINTSSQRKLGKTYYPAFKASLMTKFYLRSLKRDGFKCIKDTINFFGETSNSTIERVDYKNKMIEKMANEQGFSKKILKNLNNMNSFVDYGVQDYKHLIKICEGSYLLRDEELSSEAALWGLSFDASLEKKQTSRVNTHGASSGDTNVMQGFDITGDDVLLQSNAPDMSFTPSSSNSIGVDPTTGLVNLDQLLSGDVFDFETLKYETNLDNLFKL